MKNGTSDRAAAGKWVDVGRLKTTGFWKRRPALFGILLIGLWPLQAMSQGYSPPRPDPSGLETDAPGQYATYQTDPGQRDALDSPPFFQLNSLGYLFPQKASTRLTWLPGSGDDLGITQWTASTSHGAPLPNGQGMLNITPSFGVTMLNGPVSADLPADLYNISLSLAWMTQINERMNLAIGVSPGIASDLENMTSEAFRMMGFATGTWQYNPEWQLQFGVAVLGRKDIPALPVAGLVWTPNADTRVDIGTPRPRVARRIASNNTGLFAGDNWVFLAGEFGGGTWAIQRESGADDLVTLRDFRLIVGFETKSTTGPNWLIETGYVFGREIEYESRTPDIEPGDTVLFRTGLLF
jgi:hypothetical protein